MKDNKYFTYGFLIISGFFLILILFLKSFLSTPYINPHIWYIFTYVILLTAGSYLMVAKGIKKNPYTGYNYIMGFSTLRLLISIIAIAIYLYYFHNYGISFLVNFFILYFTFTTFEIKCLFSNLRSISKNSNK